MTVYRGWVHCMSTMVKEEGLLSLWKGTLPRLLWVGMSSAIWYGTYQAVRQGISKRRVHRKGYKKDVAKTRDVVRSKVE